MDKPMAAETETLRQVYAALNRGDIEAMIKAFDPQIERAEFVDSPHGGTYHGLEAVKAHIIKARETWAEGNCEPEQFIVAGDKIIVLVHVRVRLKTETEWREGHTADVFTFHKGKVTQFHTFANQQQAIEWAGAKA
ncbi:MAG: nuclear transport factor 2 family protein [Planctomycetes bacterium]|nr:nuclear transport factor 2 family protein [Planctomycetota bacterium]